MFTWMWFQGSVSYLGLLGNTSPDRIHVRGPSNATIVIVCTVHFSMRYRHTSLQED